MALRDWRRGLFLLVLGGVEEDIAGEVFGGVGGVAEDAPGVGAEEAGGEVFVGEDDGEATVEFDAGEARCGGGSQFEDAELAEVEVSTLAPSVKAP